MMQEDNSISFFMLAHKEPRAVDFSLQSVRKWYPYNKIIVIENGSHVLERIAQKHDAEYIYQEVNYMKVKHRYAAMYSKKDFELFFDQHMYVCETCNTKWIVYLEPDVIVRGLITQFPKTSSGGHLHTINTFESQIQQIIQNHVKYRNNKYIYIFGCAGGCIFNRKDLLKSIQNEPFEFVNKILKFRDTEEISDFRSEIQCRDACLSYILYMNGFLIEDWNQYCEIHEPETKDVYRLTFAPIIHGFKYYYD